MYKRIYLIVSLSFISLWMGGLGWIYLFDGKNLAHFMLCYVIGDTIRYYESHISTIKTKYLLFSFIIINFVPIVYFSLYSELRISDFLRGPCDNNNGLVLIINAVITFVLFLRLKIKSKIINKIAASVIVMYIIQQEPVISSFLADTFKNIWNPERIYCCSTVGDTLYLLFYLSIRAVYYMAVAIIIDWILAPIWRIIEKFAERVQQVANKYKEIIYAKA